MTLYTSDKFASAIAAGTDWRDISRKVLEELQAARTANDGFNLGFLYVTDKLAGELSNILALFKSVMGIENWVGSIGLGVCGCGVEYVDRPAISAMVAQFPEDSFCLFPAVELNQEEAQKALAPWLDRNDTMLTLVHGDPASETEPAEMLAELERLTGGFIAGGLVSSRGPHLHISDTIAGNGISGVAFSQGVNVATALTQGCAPLGPEHVITRCEGNVVMELDGLPAFEVFTGDLRKMASERTGLAPEKVKISRRVRDEDDEGEDAANQARPPEFHAIGGSAAGGELDQLFRGEVHVAFPVPGTDQQDYLVRNALGLDPEKGWVAVSHQPSPGDRMLFVHRDDASVKADLTRMLLNLRRRVRGENNNFTPRGAIYISCVARTQADFGEAGAGDCGEMRLVREVLGDMPLAGFYANGEISNRRLYGYTGVLILFL